MASEPLPSTGTLHIHPTSLQQGVLVKSRKIAATEKALFYSPEADGLHHQPLNILDQRHRDFQGASIRPVNYTRFLEFWGIRPFEPELQILVHYMKRQQIPPQRWRNTELGTDPSSTRRPYIFFRSRIVEDPQGHPKRLFLLLAGSRTKDEARAIPIHGGYSYFDEMLVVSESCDLFIDGQFSQFGPLEENEQLIANSVGQGEDTIAARIAGVFDTQFGPMSWHPLPSHATNNERIMAYSLWKQANAQMGGQAHPSGGSLGEAKWEAWRTQAQMSPSDAATKYLDLIIQLT